MLFLYLLVNYLYKQSKLKLMDKIKKFGLVVIKDKKLLVNRKKGTELFLLPGGKPLAVESPEDCLARELKEEHNCSIKNIRKFGEFEDKAANENAKVHISAYTGDLIGTPKIGSEIVEQAWYSRHDNPAKLSPIIKYKIIPALLMDGLL